MHETRIIKVIERSQKIVHKVGLKSNNAKFLYICIVPVSFISMYAYFYTEA